MKNILIVDNQPLILRLVTDLLVSQDYVVQTAADGLQALDVLSGFTPDVIFLDLIMPNIPGEKLCRIIRSKPEFSNTFVIVLSGTAMEEDIDFKGFGANACIAKGPFKNTETNILHALAMLARGEHQALGETILGREGIYQRGVTKELLAAKRHTEVIFENMAESVIEFTADNRIVYANLASLSLTETSEVELLSSQFFALFKGRNRERLEELAERLGNKPLSIDEGKPIMINGKTVTLSLLPTEGSEFQTTVAIIRDITQQKETEQELIDSRERYHDLFENAHDLIQVVHPDGHLLYVNKSWRNTLGYNEEEVRNLTVFDIIDPGCSSDCLNTFTRVLEQGNVPDIKTTFLAKNGGKISVEGAANCKYVDGKPSLARCIFRDVSERKELENQLLQSQKMQAIGTLAGGIAHDFNNILTSIIGYTQLAMREVSPESKVYTSLQHVAKSSKRASDLVQQILTFCRKSTTEKSPVHIQSIVKEVLKLIRLSLPASIEIRQNIDSSCRPVLADVTQIHQVIMNLCTNAYQAMRETGGVLLVELHEATVDNAFMARNRELTSRHCICLSVCDTGRGIEPELINRIFEPYFTTKGPSEGTGLGLAIVHGIAKSHNGAIMVTSRDGETRFTLYLPLHEQAGQISSDEVELALPEILGHIMFVDDEGDIAEMVNAVLTKTGAAVSSYTSSPAALAAFTSSPAGFDLVITDQNMPHLSGFELAKKILKLRPEIPVILCTGFSESVNEHDAKTAGIREFIQKPLNIDKLAHVIKKILTERASR